MPIDVLMPALSPTMEEGTLAKWHVKVGDEVLFYHSGGTPKEPAGVYGLAKVSAKAHPDETQFDKKDDHFEPKARRGDPIWECVDVAFVKKFSDPVTLEEIKFEPALAGIMVAQRGSRLSVQPVSERHFKEIVAMATA